MALPLPRVVYDVEPGGGIVTGMKGANALTKSEFENQIKKVEAQYAPYTTYANAASHLAYANLLPYQIQAQLMSNPMLWMAFKDKPEVIQGMMNNFASSVPKGNQIFGNINLPAPGNMPSNTTMGGGLLGLFLNALSGDSSKNNTNANTLTQLPNAGSSTGSSDIPANQEFGAMNRATPQEVNNIANGLNLDGTPRTTTPSQAPTIPTTPTSENYSRLVPATKGGLAGVTGKMTAPYMGETNKPGSTFYNEETGETVSSPTEKSRTSLQSSINAAKRVEPQLKELADAAAPFMTGQGYLKMQFERGKNYFGIGKPGDLPSKYARFQSLIQSAPEALVKSYGLNPTNETIDRMQKIIEPYTGENKDDYKARILDTLEKIKKEQIGISSEQLSQGLTVGSKTPSEKAPAQKVIKNTASRKLANEIKLPQFKNVQEFQDWYKKQTKVVQIAVKKHLEEKQ